MVGQCLPHCHKNLIPTGDHFCLDDFVPQASNFQKSGCLYIFRLYFIPADCTRQCLNHWIFPFAGGCRRDCTPLVNMEKSCLAPLRMMTIIGLALDTRRVRMIVHPPGEQYSRILVTFPEGQMVLVPHIPGQIDIHCGSCSTRFAITVDCKHSVPPQGGVKFTPQPAYTAVPLVCGYY